MIKLNEHFDYKKLIKLTSPSIMMLIFTSIYVIVDGFFVSNFTGKVEFTAVNLIMPFLLILGGFGFMFGTGASALIGKLLGEKKDEEANSTFSLVIYVSIGLGIFLTILGLIVLKPMAILLGAKGEVLEKCIEYGRIYLLGMTAFILQYEFQVLFATAERPKLGLFITLGAGFTNIILDALFVAVFKWGLTGAAWASVLGMVVGGIIPLFYFVFPNKSLLRLGKTKMDMRSLGKICLNGSSELLSSISSSVVNMLYNIQLLKYAGEDGVASFGVMMYVSMIFVAIFLGYSVGVSPVISYNYGANNNKELKGLTIKSIVLIGIGSVLMLGASQLLAMPLSKIFVGYDQNLCDMTTSGFRIFSFTFLCSGISIFGSAFFTALNNGIVSGILSFVRALVLQIIAILILPRLWGLNGIWASTVFAELLAVGLTAGFMIWGKKKYQY